MKKVLQSLYIFLFLLLIVGGGLLSLREGKEKLFYENRRKADRPALNAENLFSGQYFSQLETYFSDHFFLREDLMALGSKINKDGLKRKVVNDLYITENTILPVLQLDRPRDIEKKAQARAKDYGQLAKMAKGYGSTFIYLGIPGHVSIFADQYPTFCYNYGQMAKEIEENFFQQLDKNGVENIRASRFLTSQDHYNATDHHYNYIGAIRVYIETIEKINRLHGRSLDPYGIKSIELPGEFKGSYAKKLFYLDGFTDKAWIYKPDFRLEGKSLKETQNRLFPLDNQEKPPYFDYGIYMGGDQGIDGMETGREDLPTILIYGDSYTNPLETLFIRNAKTLYSYDFRYYKGNSLEDLIKRIRPDYVLCVRDDLNYLSIEDNGISK